MRRLTHILIIAFCSVQALCPSAFGGRVFCSTPSGHSAVEPIHSPLFECSATRGSERHPEQPVERCDDVQLGDAQMIVQGVKAEIAPLDAAPLWTYSAPIDAAFQSSSASTQLQFDQSHAPPPDAECLDTIILLI